MIYLLFKEVHLIIEFGWRERRARGALRPWGPLGAGKAAWVWAWGFLICVGCVLFAGVCNLKWLFWVLVEKGGVVGGTLAMDPGLAVEIGPGGVGRRQN